MPIGTPNANATPTNSGAFVQVYIANAAGVLTEVSQYMDGKADPKRTSNPTDLTVFATGGGPVTKTFIRGVAISEWTLSFLYDPTLGKLLRQVVGLRAGVVVQVRSGSNAAPAQGDELFSGTFLFADYTWVYNTGAKSTVVCNLKVADGAAAPTFGTL